MTPAQTNHRDILTREFLNEFPAKYNAGQAEHGGDLWEKPLANEMVKEALDFYAYAKTIARQHDEIYKATLQIQPKNAAEKAALKKIRSLTHA